MGTGMEKGNGTLHLWEGHPGGTGNADGYARDPDVRTAPCCPTIQSRFPLEGGNVHLCMRASNAGDFKSESGICSTVTLSIVVRSSAVPVMMPQG